MIHPSTELRFISPEVGHGVFATAFIPKGTITYVADDLELRLTEDKFRSYELAIQEVLDRYAYLDSSGQRIISWDSAKYTNHSCHRNTLYTGYGFEIALRDIQAGEEITDEYGALNILYALDCYCGSADCRKVVRPQDFDLYYQDWDRSIQAVLGDLPQVEQPLWSLVPAEWARQLDGYLRQEVAYRSVYSLRCHHCKETHSGG